MRERIKLESERLRIRQFDRRDLANCARFRRDVFGLDEKAEAAEQWLRWTINSYREMAILDQPPYADYAVELSGSHEFIGSVGIVPTMVPWGALQGETAIHLLSPEIGLFWGTLPEHRQQGYATEAAGMLIKFLFEDIGARQVVATTEQTNAASRKTMTKLGMTLYMNPLPEPAWRQVVGKLVNLTVDSEPALGGGGPVQSGSW